ncbi:MAG: DUF3098 domain-containing protein [Bacteroidales bacterium]
MAKGTQTKKSSKAKNVNPDPRQKRGGDVSYEDFTFGRQSYMLLFVALFLIALGFILMSGGGSDDPNVFSEEIFSRRRITVAPILVLSGYVVGIFAIMKRPSQKTDKDS